MLFRSVKLLDRAWRTAIRLESCKLALFRVHEALFPLNEQPQSLVALLKKFRKGKAIKKFVREQLVSGANVALAFVRSHLPHLDLKKIVMGPAPLPGGGPVPMEEHYQETRVDTLVLIHHVLKEEEKWTQPKDEPVD